MKNIIKICLLAMAFYSLASAETRYFVVGDMSSGEASASDSYLLPLDDADDIAYARQLIDAYRAQDYTSLSQGTIVAAHILYSDEAINRDYVQDGGTPFWSWEVSDFIGFAETSYADYDGSPALVEENPEYWGSKGMIAFWSYTVVGEYPFAFDSADRNGNKHSSWIGDFNDYYWPWVLSDQGWIYVYGLCPYNVWIWSHMDNTYFWRSEYYGDWAWDFSAGEWVNLNQLTDF